MKRPFLLLMAAILFTVPVFPAQAQDSGESFTLQVQYIEFPPYYFTNSQSQPDGFLLQLARDAFARAGIKETWESMPAKRVLQNMRSEVPICSIGWFKTPAREKFAKFSREIYRSKPLMAVFLKKNEGMFAAKESLVALMQDKSITLGLLEGYSLGLVVDEIILKGNPSIERVAGGYPQLVRMLAAERFTYMLVAPEEIDILIRKNYLNAAMFERKALSDIPAGSARYLMFSQGVPASVVERINKALIKIGKTSKK